MYLRRDLYICWKRVCVLCWSLALHCFSSSAIRFPCSSSILDYELVKAACQLREHFFRNEATIRDNVIKTKKNWCLYLKAILCRMRDYVRMYMCNGTCEYRNMRTKIMPRFWELPYVVSRRKFTVDYIRLSLDTVNMNNNL